MLLWSPLWDLLLCVSAVHEDRPTAEGDGVFPCYFKITQEVCEMLSCSGLEGPSGLLALFG